MKRYAFIIFAITLALIGLLGYLQLNKKTASDTTQGDKEAIAREDVRKVVWGQLPEQQKAELIGTWQDGRASKTRFNEINMKGSTVKNESYIGQEVYVITFPSERAATLGDVTVYADEHILRIIGYGLRD